MTSARLLRVLRAHHAHAACHVCTKMWPWDQLKVDADTLICLWCRREKRGWKNLTEKG
jgi:hypothetical protein